MLNPLISYKVRIFFQIFTKLTGFLNMVRLAVPKYNMNLKKILNASNSLIPEILLKMWIIKSVLSFSEKKSLQKTIFNVEFKFITYFTSLNDQYIYWLICLFMLYCWIVPNLKGIINLKVSLDSQYVDLLEWALLY